MSETMNGVPVEELLKVIIDKTVDNGAAIQQVLEQQRKQETPRPASEQEITSMNLLKQLGKDMEEQASIIGEGVAELRKGAEEQLLGLQRKMIPIDKIEGLRRDLEQNQAFFREPVKKEVHVRYFLGQPLLVLTGLLFLLCGMGILIERAWTSGDRYKEEAFKWRAARLWMDSTVTKVLDKMQRDYLADPEQFRKDVEAEEERRQELLQREMEVAEKVGEVQETEKKINDLKGKGKRH